VSSDIIRRFIECLCEAQPSFSEEVALGIEQQLRHEYAGEQVYIPKFSGTLHDEIVKRFDCNNVEKLVKELAISRRTVGRILLKVNDR
jgi:Mor family transcriptional regulator